MGEEGPEAPENPSPGEQERLQAARSLLERNGELVFQLNGLAALRRTSGRRPPSAEERALLAEAQRCLQDAASLLPPQILVPATVTKRLRQQLEPAAAAAENDPSTHKRRLVVRQLKEGQADARQAAMDGLRLDELLTGAEGDRRKQDMEQLEGMLFSSRVQLALEGQAQQQQQEQGQAEAAALPNQQQQQPQQQDHAAEGSSGPPPEGLLSLNAFAGSPRQPLVSGMLSQAFLHGLRPQSSFGDLVGVGSTRLPSDLGLLPVSALGSGLGSATLASGQLAQPRNGGSALGLGGERLAAEDAFLLSKAYSSMSTEQKERLAAQPPEVRHYVLRERMRRTKQQLQQLQAQQPAVSGASTPPASRPGSRPLPQGAQAGQWDATQPAGQQQDVGAGACHSTSPTPVPGEQPVAAQQPPQAFAWRQQQAHAQAQPPSTSPPPDHGFTADSQLLQQEQQQRSQGLPLRLAALGQLAPGTLAGLQQVGAQLPGGLGGLGALLSGGLGSSLGGGPSAATAGAAAGQDGSPFVAMDEEQRLEHLRSLKRRQEEWLEQQRLAAARLAQPGSG
ncbi:hypothetical protein C2E21_8553 [Chlorella sorokiniana]|uniref:Uncharacterized protein n=1 Tax=Chlorella sorokiniana TaxID=3076 RepID=A0A2P6TE60_CHLSO|nr:hypothetical protein C2E21_8553 [Chlorella sorokiniana]|eukprot:PRW20935.1 hypothetical protein C2E21_8553 [Chlorella sorokiniana]